MTAQEAVRGSHGDGGVDDRSGRAWQARVARDGAVWLKGMCTERERSFLVI